jgi:hypothetical protein
VIRRALLAASVVALAGCGSGPNGGEASVQQREQAQARAAAQLTGWDRVFASPSELVGAVNQGGFGLGDYAAAKTSDGYRAEGHPRLFSRSGAQPNLARAVLSGASPDRVDTIRLTLSLDDPGDATTARGRLAEFVGNFLARFRLSGGAPLVAAIRAGKPGTYPVDGVPATVAVSPTTLDVTITRAPATSGAATQGK